MLDKNESWTIAYLSLVVLNLLLFTAFGACALFLSKSRGDPARTWVRLLKLTFVLFSACLLWNVIENAIYLAILFMLGEGVYYLEDKIDNLWVGVRQSTGVSDLLYFSSEISIFLLFISLGAAIERVISGKEKKPANFGFVRSTAYIISLILSVLVVAQWGMSIKVDLKGPLLIDLLTAEVRLMFAIGVILTALSLVVAVWSVTITVKSRSAKRCKAAAGYLVACSLLWLLSRTFKMAIDIKYNNFSNLYDSRPLDHYISILDIVLNQWPTLALLVILFFLSQMKANGVWSTEQHFMTTNPVAPGMGPYVTQQHLQPQVYFYNQHGSQQPYVYHEATGYGARAPPAPPPQQRVEAHGYAQPPPTEMEQPYRNHEMAP